jgi:gliding motility-associated-like protein
MRTLNFFKAKLFVLSVFLFGGTFYTQNLLAYSIPKISNYNVTRLSCKGSNDGKVELQVSGGAAPYRYKVTGSAFQSSNTFNSLAPGTFKFCVFDSFNNSDTISITVLNANLYILSSIVTPTSCLNTSTGKISLNLYGGVGGYNFAWTNSNGFSSAIKNITNLETGIYYVKITDANGCVKDTQINVGYKNSISATITKGDVKCYGQSSGSAKVNVTSSLGLFSVSWTGPASYSSTNLNITNLNYGTYYVTVKDTTGCSNNAYVNISAPSLLTIKIKSIADVLCANNSNGKILTETSGGRKPYSYSWTGSSSYTASTPDITNASYGSYQIQVTDSSGCIATASAAVNEPAVLSATSAITNITCYGVLSGKIIQTVSGGVKPFQYLWSSGNISKDLVNVNSGNYTVTITDSNGCYINKSYSITAPTKLVVTYSSTNVKCNGQTNGSLTAFGSGGTYPWTFLTTGPNSFSSSIVANKNLGAGTYKVLLKDANNCRDSQFVAIIQPSAISVIKKAIQPSCNGLKGSLSLIVGGGTSPYTFEWTDNSGSLYAATQNVVSADAGKYTYNVYDANQCTVTDTILIYQPAKLKLAVKSLKYPVCYSETTGTIKLTTVGGLKNYSFQLNGQAFQSDSVFNNLGKGLYSISVRDKNYCSDTVNLYLKFSDTVKPKILLKNPKIYLNASGIASLQLTQLDSGITDNCEVNSIVISKTSFSCNELGKNTVQVTVSDLSGNQNIGSAYVYVIDTIKPSIVSKAANIYLNAAGLATLTTSDVNKSSYDNCRIDSLLISKSTFNCANLGVNQIVLKAVDNSKNQNLSNVYVTVIDTVLPTVRYKNINCYLNTSGIGKILPQDVNNGSFDNCGIVSYALSQQTFDCSQIGTNFVNFIIADKAGNSVSQSVKITVIDSISPKVKINAKSLYLNQYGYVVLSPSDIDSASTDNCKISTKIISKSVFTCGNIGNNTVIYTVSDPSGNSTTVSAPVVIYDTIVPINKTRNTSVYLDNNGYAVLSLYDVDNGSSDNCGIAKSSLSKDRFYCFELGKKYVEFKTSDASGNTTKSTIEVSVVDTIRPVIKTINKNIYLDKQGKFSIAADYFDAGSYDNCGIKIKKLSQYDFDCTDVGNKLLLYTIIDTTGNSAISIVNIKVFDTISPILYTKNQTLYLGTNGQTKLSKSIFEPFCSDNCSISSLYLSDSIFTCKNIGNNLVYLNAIDKNGNRISQQFQVIIIDTISPILTTKSPIIYIDTAGFAHLFEKDFVVSKTDNCSIASVNYSKDLFGDLDVGQNWVSAFIKDASGNVSITQFVKVTVKLGDADNDSIPDYIERALDFDQDGVANYMDQDSDNDGILDVDENDGLKILLDLDQDGYANIYDYDTDKDGILDIFEVNGYDPDRNGRVGIGKVLVSNNGIPVLSNNSIGYPLIFTDKDLVPDYKDIDSDNDLILDKIECGPSNLPIDSDNDGQFNFRDLDSDNDLISDSIETIFDFDYDGKSNYIDLDSDGDGILDLTETNFDHDNDGWGSWLDLDADGDAIPDKQETSGDLDNDGKGNWIDNDSDNDLITDNIELNFDADADGILDFLDIDSDNDGISDLLEGTPFVFNNPADSDADGQFDFRDLDSDNDGISDDLEGFANPTIPDTDKDGIPDFRDKDSDNDGVLDINEGIKDTDSDGFLDAVDSDSDEDGIPDLIETNSDSDADGIPNYLDLDSDNDGINDVRECRYDDLDGSGMVKNLDSCITLDIDGDGLFNFIDTDSDGDGISDLAESGSGIADANFDGRVDGTDLDKDGIQDLADGLSGKFGDTYDAELVNTDSDTLRDFEDIDSDNDKIDDQIETIADKDLDLIPNYLDLDSDNDNIKDSIETNFDFDNDGIGNWLDEDSDDDNILDSSETINDFDSDGMPNYLDLDSDNDEVSDAIEGIGDSDLNSIRDFLDPQTFVPEVFTPNNDGVNDVFNIKGLINYPNAELTVFNQWGQVVFKSGPSYKNNWNGTNTEGKNFNRGIALPEGIYFYVLDHNRNDSPSYTKPQTKGNIYIKP